MSLNKFSRFVQADLGRSDRVETSKEITSSVGDAFLALVLTGNLNEDVLLVKGLEQKDTGTKLLPLRLANGRMVSALTLRNLLTISMQKNARKRMGKAGRLTNRTGDLLGSATVEPQIINNNNTVSLQFSYMFAPYEVFDPKSDVTTDAGATRSRLSSKARSPRRLFTESLREAAKEVLFRGYDITVSQVGVTNR